MKYFSFIIMALFSLTACAPAAITSSDLHRIALVSPAGETVDLQVEFAVTHEEQQMGLMNRNAVTGDGMLFIFDQPQVLYFWMKNTLIPLDIVYFDAQGNFVSSDIMTPCTEDPCQTYPSKGEAKYALEAPEGSLQKQHVGTGWQLTLR